VRIVRVVLPVTDIDRAATFYGALAGAVGRRVSPGRHDFDLAGAVLTCHAPHVEAGDPDAVDDVRPNPDWIVFQVDDIERVHTAAIGVGARLPAEVVPGIGPLGRIAVRPWGERSFYAEDPFGNRICFVESPRG
jgi:extradiol dioxygenase family protein